LVLATLNGAWVFVLQVSWSRMFAQVHENSIYSLALILAVLLVGLAVGSACARTLLARGWDPFRVLAGCWLAGGGCVIWTPSLFWAMTAGLAYVNAPGGWVANGWRLLELAVPTVFLPSVFVGTGFPLLLQIAGERVRDGAGRVVGGLAAAGTLGSIVGSLAAASLLPSTLGLWWTLAAVGAALAVAGALVHRGGGSPAIRWAQGLGGAVLIAASLLWVAPGTVPRTRVREDHGERLVDLQESSHGVVAVVESAGSRRIKLNNFYVLGGTASTGDERMQGHLPLLLHPAPRKVAFLGLGTGITAGAALLHPVDRITAVEIVPEVIAAVRRNRENQPWLELLGPLHHAGRGEGRVPLFVGRRLQPFLDELRSGVGARGVLSLMGAEETRWREAGRRRGL
jgi:spermidine synthase